MKSSHFSDKAPEDEKERHPGGNPLLVILVLVICATAFLAFTSSVAKAESKTAPQTAEQAAPKPWKPPVAMPAVPKPPVDKETAKKIAEKWGIEMLSLRLAAAGYMIDFRFKVLDLEKARIFFDSRIKPHLKVEKSNAKLPIPMAAKVGAFRPTNRGMNIKSNKTYYMVFGNPDAHVKSGEKVTMVIGDFKAENLTVN
ncbi:MAG: hypothetical protein JAY97_05315 [Candidatus Thiodiazotropha sp. 'RUGA']|nr:hypothetical protein [Candidatus Thiodiazotropha sp. 'RUGA']